MVHTTRGSCGCSRPSSRQMMDRRRARASAVFASLRSSRAILRVKLKECSVQTVSAILAVTLLCLCRGEWQSIGTVTYGMKKCCCACMCMKCIAAASACLRECVCGWAVGTGLVGMLPCCTANTSVCHCLHNHIERCLSNRKGR